jgi:hypothetical protein
MRASMMRREYKLLMLVCAGLALLALLWWIMAAREPAVSTDTSIDRRAQAGPAAKPICTSPVNPSVAAPLDCIPANLANLPPDPGEAGKATIDGVDRDADGMRDDVQRWIAENWGHSELAVRGLTIVAQIKLLEVHYGGDLGKEETRKLGPDLTRRVVCASTLETTQMLKQRAYTRVKLVVLNTPERWKRSREFDQMFANSIIELPNITSAEACGFDPSAMIARSGEQTVSGVLAAERARPDRPEDKEAGK